MGTGLFACRQNSHHVSERRSATDTALAHRSLLNLQDVVITDPYLMAQILHDTNLYKPAKPDYIKFRRVSTHYSCMHLQRKAGSCCMKCCKTFQLICLPCLLQLMGPSGIADLVTAESDAEDWLWKTVRKGVAPAFAPQALRSALTCCNVIPLLSMTIWTYMVNLQLHSEYGLLTSSFVRMLSRMLHLSCIHCYYATCRSRVLLTCKAIVLHVSLT